MQDFPTSKLSDRSAEKFRHRCEMVQGANSIGKPLLASSLEGVNEVLDIAILQIPSVHSQGFKMATKCLAV